jgi:hypothetical protein
LPGPDRKRAALALDFFLAIDEGQSSKAAACRPQDREGLLAWYDCPAEPWRYRRPTNPVASLGPFLWGNLGAHRRHAPRTLFSDPGPHRVPDQPSGRSPRIPESSQGPLRGAGPSDVYTAGIESGSSRRGVSAGVAITWGWPELVSALPQALPTTFLLFLDSTDLAFAFWPRGGFVALGCSHGRAWCLATRGLREWLGLLKAVPQITDHPGYTLHHMPKHAQLLAGDVSQVLIPPQTGCPNSYRLMKSPITRSRDRACAPSWRSTACGGRGA